MRIFKDIKYGKTDSCTLDVYVPDNETFSATFVHFHGGGIEQGDKTDPCCVDFADSFTKIGYGYVSVNYRMYTAGAKFPEFLEDAAEAVAWVKTHIKEYGGNGDLYLSGQSAGAWLSVMLCLNEKYLNAVGMSPLEIKGWVIDSSQMTAHYNVLKYETGGHPSLQRINEYAPLYFVNEDTKFTRMLLFFYEEDLPTRPEQNMLFIKTVQNFNKEADIAYKRLKGGHCQGSTLKDSDGEYPYIKEIMRWLK